MYKFLLLAILAFSAISAVISKDQGIAFLNDLNRDARIIQGSPATQTQFPHQALLEMKNANNQWIMCGGALISTRWVLTAAHCLLDRVSVLVRLGSVDYTKPQILITDLTSFYAHEKYNKTTANNDVGVVNLGRDVAITASVWPIRLPTRSQTTETFVGKTSVAIGWGQTQNVGPPAGVLNYVQLRVITNQRCIIELGALSIAASNICAVGIKNLTQGACFGDSGSPLFMREADGLDTHIGVTSFVSGAGCDADYATGFARTSSYIDWISQKTGIAIRP